MHLDAPLAGIVRRGALLSGVPFTAGGLRAAPCRKPFLGARTAVPGTPSIPDLATGPNGAVTLVAPPPTVVLATDTVNVNAVLPPAAIYQEVRGWALRADGDDMAWGHGLFNANFT